MVSLILIINAYPSKAELLLLILDCHDQQGGMGDWHSLDNVGEVKDREVEWIL